MMNKNIRFGFCNIWSIRNRMDAVNRFFRNKKLDIFFIVETWLRPDEGHVSINGTYPVVDMRQEKHEGIKRGYRERVY